MVPPNKTPWQFYGLTDQTLESHALSLKISFHTIKLIH